MQKQEKLSSSLEDYLETIVVLKKDNGVVRVKDISDKLNVKRPSVSGALKVLIKKGFIIHEKYGYVELTPSGEKLAEKVKRKHEILIKFLTGILGINRKTAERDACGIEHSISHETLNHLTEFVSNFEKKDHKIII